MDRGEPEAEAAPEDREAEMAGSDSHRIQRAVPGCSGYNRKGSKDRALSHEKDSYGITSALSYAPFSGWVPRYRC